MKVWLRLDDNLMVIARVLGQERFGLQGSATTCGGGDANDFDYMINDLCRTAAVEVVLDQCLCCNRALCCLILSPCLCALHPRTSPRTVLGPRPLTHKAAYTGALP